MQLVRFDDAVKFDAEAGAFLAAHEAKNNLFLGLLSTLKIDLHRYGEEVPYLALVKAGDGVCGAALRTPPYNLLLSWMDDPVALQMILADARQKYGTLPGMIGETELTKTAVERWHDLTGQPYRVRIAERSYQLEQVNPVPYVPGAMRLITPADRELVIEWLVAFGVEAGVESDRAGAEHNTDRALVGRVSRFYVWEDEGTVVSLAGCTGETPNGIRVGPVYTPPEYRRKGYATALVAALSQLLLDEGRKYCFLFTDLSNPTSNHIYTQIGYRPVCDVDMYEFGTETT